MLVHRDFGTPAAGVTIPYFTLYNKYRGIFRVCIFNAPHREDSFYIGKIQFNDPDLRPSNAAPLLTLTNTSGKCFISDFDTKQSDAFLSMMNKYGDWATFDFQLTGYDPALGTKDPVLLFSLVAVKRSNIRMEGEGELKLWQETPSMLAPTLSGNTSAGDVVVTGLGGAWSAGSFKEWTDYMARTPSIASQPWGQFFRTGSAALAKNSFGTILSLMDTVVGFWMGGSETASAWEPIFFRGQQTFRIEGGIEREARLQTLALGLNAESKESHSIRIHRPVQKIPWGVFNIESRPEVTGDCHGLLNRKIWLASEPVIRINPEAGLELRSVSYRFIINHPTREFDPVKGQKVVVAMRPDPRPASTKEKTLIGSQAGVVSDLLVELRFRTTAPTRDADPDITVLKRVPMKFTPTVAGTYTLPVEFRGEQYMYIRSGGKE